MYYPARHSRLLEKALAVAATSTERQRHATIIAKGNKVLSVGVNRGRNVPLNVSNPKSEAAVHSEIAALRALPPDTDYSRVTIYNARLKRTGAPGLSKPCSSCQAVLDFLGVREVIYTEEVRA